MWLGHTHLAGSWQKVQLDVGVRKAVVVHRLEALEFKTGQLIADPEPKGRLYRACAEVALRGQFRCHFSGLNF